MIDTSAYALWGDDEICFGEGYDVGDEQADSPRARRLQVLIAEARAAGTPWRMIVRIFVDWIGVVLPGLPRGESRDVLQHEIACAETLLAGRMPTEGSRLDVRRELEDLDRVPDRGPARALAIFLNSVTDNLANDILKRDVDMELPHSGDAWIWAVEGLATIDELGGEAAIARCAEIAYGHLFPSARKAREHEAA
jgi:hypothetical protein